MESSKISSWWSHANHRYLFMHKLCVFGVYSVFHFLLYIVPNHVPLVEPRQLPLTIVDSETPLIPWTFTIYLSVYIMFFSLFFLINNEEKFNAWQRTAYLTVIVCGIFFVFFPTTYPRPEYPVVSNPIVSGAMQLVRENDTPNNCFPSEHVALSGTVMWASRNIIGKWFFYLYIFWGLSIFGSTLTTKQHYLVDVFCGSFVALSTCYLDYMFHKKGLWSRMWEYGNSQLGKVDILANARENFVHFAYPPQVSRPPSPVSCGSLSSNSSDSSLTSDTSLGLSEEEEHVMNKV